MEHPTPDQIRALRDKSGMTQASMAALLYMTVTGYAMNERGERTMSKQTWQLMQILLKDEIK